MNQKRDRSEKELQSELELPRPLRVRNPAKVRRSRIKRTIRGSAEEGPDRVVKSIQPFESEFQPFSLRKEEVFVETQIHIGVSRTTDVSNMAGSEGVWRRIADVGGIKPLNESSLTSLESIRIDFMVQNLDWTITVG